MQHTWQNGCKRAIKKNTAFEKRVEAHEILYRYTCTDHKCQLCTSVPCALPVALPCLCACSCAAAVLLLCTVMHVHSAPDTHTRTGTHSAHTPKHTFFPQRIAGALPLAPRLSLKLFSACVLCVRTQGLRAYVNKRCNLSTRVSAHPLLPP